MCFLFPRLPLTVFRKNQPKRWEGKKEKKEKGEDKRGAGENE